MVKKIVFYEEIKLSQIEHDYLSKKKILIIVLTLILCLLKESTIIVF